MKIIETYIMGRKGNLDTCEDEIFISQDFIAVIDGVTSKGIHLWDHMTSGKKASLIIKEALSDMPRDIIAKDLFTCLSENLRNAYKKEIEEDSILEYLRASIIIYSKSHNQIWSYGDCQCMINGNCHTHEKEIDAINSKVRSFIIHHSLLIGHTTDELLQEDSGRKFIMPLLENQFAFENLDCNFGYPVLNGRPINQNLIVTYQLNPCDEIILASDGYPELKSTLKDSEKTLKEILKEDPMGINRNMTTKGLSPESISFDDRAFIRFKV